MRELKRQVTKSEQREFCRGRQLKMPRRGLANATTLFFDILRTKGNVSLSFFNGLQTNATAPFLRGHVEKIGAFLEYDISLEDPMRSPKKSRDKAFDMAIIIKVWEQIDRIIK